MREICHTTHFDHFTFPTSYWVIVVVPYLLYAFVTNHTQEVCEKIYKVNAHRCLHANTYLCRVDADPSRVGDVEPSRVRVSVLISPHDSNSDLKNNSSCSAHSYICFLQSQCVPSCGARLCPGWCGCIPALRGRITNDTSVKLIYSFLPWSFTFIIVLAFVTPPYVSEESAKTIIRFNHNPRAPVFRRRNHTPHTYLVMTDHIVWITTKHTLCRIFCASRPGANIRMLNIR